MEPEELAMRLTRRTQVLRERNDDYRTVITGCFAASILALTILFRIPFQPETSFEITMAEQEIVALEEIEQTRQIDQPPPPPLPQVPVLVANDELLDIDEILFDSELDVDRPVAVNLPPPPAPKAEPREDVAEIFVVVEEMPEIVGGISSVMRTVKYPEMARKAGLEGMVVVQVVIEPDGTPSNPVIARSGGTVLDEAALAGVMELQYKPGRQRGQPVRVRFAIPVNFRLSGA